MSQECGAAECYEENEESGVWLSLGMEQGWGKGSCSRSWDSVAWCARCLLVYLAGDQGYPEKSRWGLSLHLMDVLVNPASGAHIVTASAEPWLCLPPDKAKRNFYLLI